MLYPEVAIVIAASLLVMSPCAVSVSYDTAESSGASDESCDPDATVLECICNSGRPKPFQGAVLCMRDTNISNIYDSKAILNPLSCIWYDKSSLQLLAGLCPFGRPPSTVTFNRTVTVEEASMMTCAEGHTGVMCGRCESSHSLLFNSYTFDCTESDECSTAYWILFLFQQLLPTLIFFVVFIFFNIKAVQGYLNAFVLAAQVISVQMNLISIYLGWGFALKFDDNYLSKELTDVPGH